MTSFLLSLISIPFRKDTHWLFPRKRLTTCLINERIEAGGSYISDEDLGEMMVFAKKVAQAIKASIPCQKVGVTVIGLEVRHAHIHLIPMQKEGDMDFSKKTTFPDDVMKATAEEIQKNFNA